MTHKEQYIAFLPFFQAEEKRYAALTQRATTFLGLTSIIVLFGGVNAAKLSTEFWPSFFAVATTIAVLLAVLGSLDSLRPRAYKDICDLHDLVSTIAEEQYDENDIYSKLLADMADATRHNHSINSTRASRLQFSASCFALAIVFVAVTPIIPRYEPAKKNSASTPSAEAKP